MKSLMLVTALIFLLMLAGCGGNSQAPTPPPAPSGTVTSATPATTPTPTPPATEAEDEESTDIVEHESGLPGYWPLYPGAVFVEEEDLGNLPPFIRVFIYESNDDVGSVFDWYVRTLGTVPEFESVEIEYESEEFCKVNAELIVPAWNTTIEDQVQIDSRARDNTQLRFIVGMLDNLPGT